MRWLGWLVVLTCGTGHAAGPAVLGTLEDSDLAFILPDPGTGLPAPAQSVPLGLPAGFRAHGVAFAREDEVLVGDFSAARLVRIRVSTGAVVGVVPLAPRSFGDGSLAMSPTADVALSAGESASGAGELVAVRGVLGGPTSVAPIPNAPRVRRFSTQSIAFAPDGRAFVCHAAGIAVLDPPYERIAFDVPLPATTNATSCRVSRDGARLFVARAGAGIGVVAAPFTPTSAFVTIAAPAGTGGLVALGVAPDGDALLVGQAFRPTTSGPRARLFLVRAPYTAQSTMSEIALPAAIAGNACSGAGSTLCPGFEDLDVSPDGALAIATGNSSRVDGTLSGRAPALVIRHPFDDALRELHAVTIGDAAAGTDGRGTGGVQFLPHDVRIFADGFEGDGGLVP